MAGVRRARGALLLAAGVALAGCSLFGGASKQPPAPLPATAAGGPRIVQNWSLSLGGASGIGFAPVAIGDAVWAATREGTVAKVSIDT
ncbi:MAG: outer membrane protein assembly factor BamB, partial [Burkholderiales bacterium]